MGEKEKLKDLPITREQEDLVQRELTTLDNLSSSERRTMSESTLLEEKSREVTRLSIKPQRFKDSSPRRESEERSSTRELRSTTGKHPRKTTSPTRNSSPSTSRKRRLPPRPKLRLPPPPQLLLPRNEL